MKKIGIIGCGTIGTGIAEFISKEFKNKAIVVALCDVDLDKAKRLSRKIKPSPSIMRLDELIRKSDLVVEAASGEAAGVVVRKSILNKKDCLIMSTGGLLKTPGLLKEAKAKGVNIYIPSGAVCGVDGLISASAGRIKKVRLTTRKPAKGLIGAPYLKSMGIDIKRIKKETVIYKGSARDAVRHFPQNINVAATVSLSGIGPDRTQVRIITSPEYKRNTHELEVEGDFGRLFTRTENLPSKENPKTSQLAIFSALAKLREVT
ncbi:MAG: aspartate dehydrogenase [Candidatus Omnitrophota bacterium]